MVRRTVGLALGLALAVLVVAGGAVSANSRIEREIVLTPTAAGRAIDASGDARVRKDGARQDFKVEIDANVADGTVYRVFVTNSQFPGETRLAGRIVIAAGGGQLELSNENGRVLPHGVAPVLRIQTVIVKNAAGQNVLRGTF
jgi:hypothetical protein